VNSGRLLPTLSSSPTNVIGISLNVITPDLAISNLLLRIIDETKKKPVG
jgi:hypothetical protein